MGLGIIAYNRFWVILLCKSPRFFWLVSKCGTLIKHNEYRVAPVLGGVDTPEARAVPLAGIPIGRISTPTDIANAACYLASDEANFLTVCIDFCG